MTTSPATGRIPSETPVEGLHPTSAWGNPGGFAGALVGGEAASTAVIDAWAKQ